MITRKMAIRILYLVIIEFMMSMRIATMTKINVNITTMIIITMMMM